VLAGLAMIAVLIGIGLSPDDLPGQVHFASYHTSLVHFEYPAAWQVKHFDEQTSYTTLLATLSNQPLHDPCAPHSTSSCTLPLARLRPGGVLAEWTGNSLPGWSFAKAPGVARTIGGRAARVLVSHPGNCKALGGDETITAFFKMQVADQYYEMAACVRGPGVSANTKALMTSLASTRFAEG
jgi:hypothetical protein